MRRALILSVRPEHAYNIITGKKTLELRKRVPKGYKGWVYVYVTNGKPYITMQSTSQFTLRDDNGYTNVINGTIPFRFWFDEYTKLKYGRWVNHKVGDWNYRGYMDEHLKTFNKLCLSEEQVSDYGKGKDLYAWHINNLEIFDKPMELGEFENYMPKETKIPEWAITSSWQILHEPITKAPQSYMYAWVKEEGK